MTFEGVFFGGSDNNFFCPSFQLGVEGGHRVNVVKEVHSNFLDKCFLWSLKEPRGLSAVGLFVLSIFVNKASLLLAKKSRKVSIKAFQEAMHIQHLIGG